MLRAIVSAWVLAAAAFAAVEDSTKNDAQILKDAQNKLKNKRFSGIQVAVQSGVATLSGSVPLYADKQDAQKNVGKVKNVVSVVNDIQVQAGETTDQQLADKIGKQLAYDRVGYGNAFNAITVSVQNGVVTLVAVEVKSAEVPADAADTERNRADLRAELVAELRTLMEVADRDRALAEAAD